jgi:hypothetical protein
VRFTKYLIRVALPCVLLSGVIARPAHASLVFQGLEAGGGAGIGTSNVILTVQNTGTESGCVAWNGTASVVGSTACPAGLSPAITGGNEKTGSSQTQTQTVTSTGVLDAYYLTIILNGNEPSGDAITVNNISLSIYNPTTGAVLFNSGNLTGSPIVIASTAQGQGNLGFGFTLDSAQAALANPFITCASCGSNMLGLAVLLSDAQGSNETFSIIYLAPEPFTALTFASGLAAIALFRRYRRAKSRA